ncbi:hypothetical protein ACFVGY_05895 [Streptomyces sp. NPDC127106]|uniref:hypothetical protein n=1 Tax=Streptomyces sp. NPDC127106 TaxID=3345360 RepID=UPI0036300FDE
MGNGAAQRDDGRPVLQGLDRRINELIAVLYPDERTRPGYTRLAKEIRDATGGTISGTYLWELATGKKRNITLAQLDVLAEFFGVPLEYFLNDEVYERVNSQMELAVALRNAKIRSIALRANGLPAASLDALLTMVTEARKLQNLQDGQPPEERPSPATGEEVRPA